MAIGAGLLGGCATPPERPRVISHPPLLRPVANPSLVPVTHGSIRPRYAHGALARGFGTYDDELQSSLFLCAGTGPAVGPCLGVLGGLFALAGATSSLVYSMADGAASEDRTGAATRTFAALPAIASLADRIGAAAVADASAAGRTVLTAPGPCILPDAGPADTLFDLDIAALELTFEPGHRFALTVVARLVERGCPAGEVLRTQRLADLGTMRTLTRDPTQAGAELAAALDAAVVALGAEVDLYLAGKRERITP